MGQIWVNQGTIAATATSASLTVRGRFYNEGTITAAAGTYYAIGRRVTAAIPDGAWAYSYDLTD